MFFNTACFTAFLIQTIFVWEGLPVYIFSRIQVTYLQFQYLFIDVYFYMALKSGIFQIWKQFLNPGTL